VRDKSSLDFGGETLAPQLIKMAVICGGKTLAEAITEIEEGGG
jgi:hypothetical protein